MWAKDVECAPPVKGEHLSPLALTFAPRRIACSAGVPAPLVIAQLPCDALTLTLSQVYNSPGFHPWDPWRRILRAAPVTVPSSLSSDPSPARRPTRSGDTPERAARFFRGTRTVAFPSTGPCSGPRLSLSIRHVRRRRATDRQRPYSAVRHRRVTDPSCSPFRPVVRGPDSRLGSPTAGIVACAFHCSSTYCGPLITQVIGTGMSGWIFCTVKHSRSLGKTIFLCRVENLLCRISRSEYSSAEPASGPRGGHGDDGRIPLDG